MTTHNNRSARLGAERSRQGYQPARSVAPGSLYAGFRRRVEAGRLLKRLNCPHRPRHSDPLFCEFTALRGIAGPLANPYDQTREAWLQELEQRTAEGWGPFDIFVRFGECNDGEEQAAIRRGLARRAQDHPDEDVAGTWERNARAEARRARHS